MIHTFYNIEENNFLSVDDQRCEPKRLTELLAEAQKKVGKCIVIIHEGEIHITKI